MADEMQTDGMFSSQNSDSPESSQTEQSRPRRRQPCEVRKQNSISDAERFPLVLERYFNDEGLLLPLPAHLLSMDSQSKVWSMQAPQDHPAYIGWAISFVDKCSSGPSEELLKVIYFWEMVNAIAEQSLLNGFAVPSTELPNGATLELRTSKKDVTGIFYCENMNSDQSFTLRQDGFMNTSRLLASSVTASTGPVKTAIPIVNINLGFTAASFTHETVDDEEQKEQCIFGVVTITSPMNIDIVEFVNQLLAAPQKGLNYERNTKRHADMLSLLEGMIIYQSSHVLRDESGMRPSMFFNNPTGHLGIDTVCNTALEPIKMSSLLIRHFNNPRNIRIIGYPQIDWRSNPDAEGPLKKYIAYQHGRLGHAVHARAQLKKAIHTFYRDSGKSAKKQRRGTEEEQEEQEELQLEYLFGWPIEQHNKWYTEFVSNLCPINLVFRRLRCVDVYESYECWSINIGQLPQLALCLLRGCMLYDADSANTRLDNILLRDLEVKWNMAEIRARYYNKGSKPQMHIAMPGCLLGNYIQIVQYIQDCLRDGSMAAETAVRLMNKCIDYGITDFVGMIESNAFLSLRVKQALEITNRIRQDHKRNRINFSRSMQNYQRFLLKQDGNEHLFVNPYDRARATMLEAFADLNKFQKLNSQNLQLMIETMISMVAHSLGSENKTLKPFGQGIELAPCCGTLSEMVQVGPKKCRIRHVPCANSAGKDFTCNFVTKLFDHLCKRVGIFDSMQGLQVLTRFTPVAIENMTCIQIEDGEIISIPDQNMNFVFFILTESRGNREAENDIVIKFIYQRGDKQNKASVTTCENDKKNRELVIKQFMSHLRLCLRCSNEKISSVIANEQMNTIGAVTMFLEAGSSPYVPVRREGDLTHMEQAHYQMRETPLSGTTAEHAPLFLAGMHLFCTTFLCLSNGVGVFQAEINPAVIAAIDWIYMVVNQHVACMFHGRCQKEDMTRLRQIYENRAAAFTAWCKTTQYLTDYANIDKAVSRAILSFKCDAIALTDVGCMFWSMIRRCMHWGPVLYASCFIRECKMPIIPIEDLVQLLSAQRAPEQHDSLYKSYTSVRKWLLDCVRKNRFVPIEVISEVRVEPEFSEYISSAGLPDGPVASNGVLRVSSSTNLWREPEKRLAQCALAAVTFEKYGQELASTCSVTAECLEVVIDDMIMAFRVDLQRVLGVSLFDWQRIATFFGLHEQLKFRYTHHRNDVPFATRAVWRKDPRETYSVGAGMHVVQLLLLGSLVGEFLYDKLHPKIINNLATSILERILLYTPRGIVPGNFVDIRSFDCFTCELERLYIEPSKTETFTRPFDVDFAKTGKLSCTNNFENFAVEDILHMGPRCEYANSIGCRVNELPVIDTTYYPRHKKAYAIYNPAKRTTGFFIFDGKKVNVDYQQDENDVDCMNAAELGLTTWHDDLAAMGFFMVPMIFRSGACVCYGNRVGCIVPSEADMTDGNFNLRSLTYCAVVAANERVDIPIMQALESLLPIGQRLYLDCAPYPNITAQEGSLLQVHLAVPSEHDTSGKLHVAYFVPGFGCCVEPIEPWDLKIVADDADTVVTYAASSNRMDISPEASAPVWDLDAHDSYTAPR